MDIAIASIARVRLSFARLQPAADVAARTFYAHLFQAHPELRPLFKGDLQAQGAKLMDMLATAVALLTRPWGLAPVLRRLGERHAGYGVQPWHYRAVGTRHAEGRFVRRRLHHHCEQRHGAGSRDLHVE